MVTWENRNEVVPLASHLTSLGDKGQGTREKGPEKPEKLGCWGGRGHCVLRPLQR